MQSTRRTVLHWAATGMALLAAAGFISGCGKGAPEKTPADTPAVTAPVAQPAQALAVPTDPSAVVVTVDGTKVTAGEINEEVARMMSRFGNRMPPERLAQMRDQMAAQAQENIVLRTLLLNQVKKENVTATDEEMATAIEQFKLSLPEGKTLDDLMKQAGMTEEEFRKNVSMDLCVNKLLTKATETMGEPTEEEIKAFFEENKERFAEPESVVASHILISVDASDDDAVKAEKKAKAEAILKDLQGGADFAAVAAEKSDCPSKARGGDLGQFTRGQMVKPFEDAAFSQKVNELGEVVETQFGYHVIKVTEHTEGGTETLEQLHDRIAKILLSQKRQQAAQEYIEGLKEKAVITLAQPQS